MDTSKYKSISLFCIALIAMFSTSTFSQTQTITTPGTSTFTVPAGVYQIKVQLWGAGGKGSSCDNIGGRNTGGGGGGGGAYASKILNVSPGSILSYNVGAGSTINGTPGGDTWFINNSTALAKGGQSPAINSSIGGLGGDANNCIGDIRFSGGNGANGYYNSSSDSQSGGGGSSSGHGQNGNNGIGKFGGIAPCIGGNGGTGKDQENEDGNPGQNPGGGGSGSKRNNNNGSTVYQGGNGGNGQIIISWGTADPLPTLITGPGGVTSDLQLWLRSDLLNGTTNTADNSDVTLWKTQARGSDASKPVNIKAPKYRNNSAFNINFNPVVDFTNNYNMPNQVYTDLDPTREYLIGNTGFFSNEIFVVVMPDVTVTSAMKGMDIFCGDLLPCQELDKTGIGFGDYTPRFTNEVVNYSLSTQTNYGNAQVNTSATYNNVGIINARNNTSGNAMQLFYNGLNIANTEVNPSTFKNVLDSRYWIGRSEGWDGSLDGRVAEIITFSNRKNDGIERSKIESYLGIKYGITIGTNGISQNYLNSSNDIIWNNSLNSGFNFDIAGIGRDDASKLNQKQSKSANLSSVVTIGLGNIEATNIANTNTFPNDKNFLIWGSNGQNLNNSGTPVVINLGPNYISTSSEVINRKWKIVETGGDIPNVKVAVPTAMFTAGLPALGPYDAYVMIVATNSTFTNNIQTIFMNTSGTNQECLYDFDGEMFFTFGIAHRITEPSHITLDGSNDIIRFNDTNELGNTFSIMTWIRLNGNNALSNDRTIVSKRNAVNGYRLVVQTDNKLRMEWTNSGTTYNVQSITSVPNGKWHNVAVTYASGIINIYIDGVLDRSASISVAPAATTSNFSIGGQYINKNSIVNLFKGDIDELRIWNRAITPNELRFTMNQEIIKLGKNSTSGKVIPPTVTKNDINTLAWDSLIAYYSMNTYIGTHLDDESIYAKRGAMTIPNYITIQSQTSPLPYTTISDGNWENFTTWTNGSIQNIPNSLSIVDGITPIDWNIVSSNHNYSSNGNKTVLGLLVNNNILKALNNSKLEVSHYLKINGKIDLEGRSQLIQTVNSDLDPTSSGSLERDQQGQKNIFNYNYWASPVGTINTTTNNNPFTVNTVMKDGTDSNNIQNIQWTAGLNGSSTTPITLSSYWIFKFQNLDNNYANWAHVGQNGTLLAGQGFTLKGSGTASSNQNFTFLGKPNNGTITSPIAANNLNLSGNPYASAIDANTFITLNSGSTTGTLYFWEHYNSNNTHFLQAYQGGYATRTLVGGTAPIAPAGISGLGSSTKTPGRFIPVGQGFFVKGSASGGNIIFDNSQRIFIKEDNANSNTMFRMNSNAASAHNNLYDNSDDSYTASNFMKIRLGFNTVDNYHRELLLGFMNELASDGIDVGYDAEHIDDQPSDMYFINETFPLNIQGVGYFNKNSVYPLGVKNSSEGTVKFMIDEKENFDANQDIFIYDNVTGKYHNIKNQNFEIDLPAGTINNRFSLRFIDTNISNNGTNQINNGIQITHTSSDKKINIKNNDPYNAITTVSVYNLLGQEIILWKNDNNYQEIIELSARHFNIGAYIVKARTEKGELSKKILIQ